MAEVQRNYPGRAVEKDEQEYPGVFSPYRHDPYREAQPYVLDSQGDDLEKRAKELVGRTRRATAEMDETHEKQLTMGKESTLRRRKFGEAAMATSMWTDEEQAENNKLVDEWYDRQDKMDAALWRGYQHYRDNPAAYYEAALDEDTVRTAAKEEPALNDEAAEVKK